MTDKDRIYLMIRRAIPVMLMTLCIAVTGTACRFGADKEDLGLKHLQEKYPDQKFTYSSYADSRSYYNVEGFEDRVIVSVGQKEPMVLYDNFLYIKYRDQLRDKHVELMKDICSETGNGDFNFCCYGSQGWMRSGELTYRNDMSYQTARDRNTEDMTFEKFMASADSNNEFLGTILVADVDAVDRAEFEKTVSDIFADNGCVYSVVRIDFTENTKEFDDSFDKRWGVFDSPLRLEGKTDGSGHLTDVSWKE